MNEDLRKWFKEKWVDISRKKKSGGHPACGASADKGVRAKDSSRKYPKCVPANKAKNMSKKQKKSAVTRKRRAPNEPGSPDNVKTDVKKESWEKWKPKSEKVYSKNLPSNNAPENPEPIGGAVAFEKSREEVLAQLKEYIQHLIKEAGPLTYIQPHRRAQVEAARKEQSEKEKQPNYIPNLVKAAVSKLKNAFISEYERLTKSKPSEESSYEDLLNKINKRSFKEKFENALVQEIAALESTFSNIYPEVIKGTELLPDDVCMARDAYKPTGLEKTIYELMRNASTREYQFSTTSSTAGIILPIYFNMKCKTAGLQSADMSNPEFKKFWKVMNNIPFASGILPRNLTTPDALKDAWEHFNNTDELEILLRNADNLIGGNLNTAAKLKLIPKLTLIINYIRKQAGQGAIPSLVQTTPQPQQPISTRNPFAPQVAPPPKLNEEKLKKLIHNMINEILKESK